MLAIVVVALVAFVLLVQRRRAQPVTARPSRFLDVLAAATIALFLVCVFLTANPIVRGTSEVNAVATRIVVRWTIVVCVALLGYRVLSRRAIPVAP